MSKPPAPASMTGDPRLMPVRPNGGGAARSGPLPPTSAAEDAWVEVDPLGEALHFLRMSGVFYCRSELRTPWSLSLPQMPHCLMFHFVTVGACRLEVAGLEPVLLTRGDLALVPHGEGHMLASDSGLRPTPLFDAPRQRLSERYEVLRLGGSGELTHLICGAIRFDHPAATHMVAQLPKVIHIAAAHTEHDEWLRSTLNFMEIESRDLRAGGETVVTRLADVLVIQAIRAWLAGDPSSQRGWLAAIQDKQIGRAMALIHRDPAEDWTVQRFARAAAMSRSAFAARFAELVGVPPMQYLARWRMHLAQSLLQHTDDPLGTIAARVGYQSEPAFSRAFKRWSGQSPGAIRRST